MAEKDLLPQLAAYLIAESDAESNRTPSERELADHFGVSRGQIREGLAILEAMRLVERQSGLCVKRHRLHARLALGQVDAGLGAALDPVQIYEAVELRKIHEIKAAELACSRATEENFEILRQILARTEARLAAGEPMNQEDKDFHLEIVRATKNDIFYRVCTLYYVLGEIRLPVYFNDPDRGRKSHAEHLQIFDALTRRDGNLAQALMSAHLQGAESYWKGLIDGMELGSAGQHPEHA